MPLRKSPTLTAARLAASRRNALKSTGPRTAWGKAFSRVNRFQHGGRSPAYVGLLKAMLNAPMGEVGRVAQRCLLSQPMIHPLFVEAVTLSVQVERDLINEARKKYGKGQEKTLTLRRSKPESPSESMAG